VCWRTQQLLLLGLIFNVNKNLLISYQISNNPSEVQFGCVCGGAAGPGPGGGGAAAPDGPDVAGGPLPDALEPLPHRHLQAPGQTQATSHTVRVPDLHEG